MQEVQHADTHKTQFKTIGISSQSLQMEYGCKVEIPTIFSNSSLNSWHTRPLDYDEPTAEIEDMSELRPRLYIGKKSQIAQDFSQHDRNL